MTERVLWFFFFFFNDTATTEIYTLSLHDALPISAAAGTRGPEGEGRADRGRRRGHRAGRAGAGRERDRKSTRLNSSHLVISYAVFCLKKKKKTIHTHKKHSNNSLTSTSYSSAQPT